MNNENTQINKNESYKNYINKSDSQDAALVKTNLLGVMITNETEENILEFILKSSKKNEKPYYIVTPNPEMLVLSSKNSQFRNILNEAKIALPDGVGVVWGAHFLGKPIQKRVIGTNLMEKLCSNIDDWPINVGFLGGRPNVAVKTAKCLMRRNPNLHVVFVGDQWGEEGFIQATTLTNKKISHTIDILFVAFGFPKQELWMSEHEGKIPVKIMMGVGGAFDQIVDPSLRPPVWIHNIGFGWLYRLIRQPWRIKRQLALLEFMWMIVREKFSRN